MDDQEVKDGRVLTGPLMSWVVESRHGMYLLLFQEIAQNDAQLAGAEPGLEFAVSMDPVSALKIAEELRLMALSMLPESAPGGMKLQ